MFHNSETKRKVKNYTVSVATMILLKLTKKKVKLLNLLLDSPSYDKHSDSPPLGSNPFEHQDFQKNAHPSKY